MAWLNINQRFNAITDHISSLTTSVLSNEESVDLHSLDEADKYGNRIRELETEKALLEHEVARLNRKQTEYKTQWIASEKRLKELTGSSTQVCEDEVDLEDEASEPLSTQATEDPHAGAGGRLKRDSNDVQDTYSEEKLRSFRTSIESAAKVINRLEDELCKVNADREHWRHLAKQKTSANTANEEEIHSQRTTIKEQESIILQLKANNVQLSQESDARVQLFEEEKASLEASLTELDAQHQNEIEKIIRVKNELAQSLASLTAEFHSLKEAHGRCEEEKSDLLLRLDSLKRDYEAKEAENESGTNSASAYDLPLLPGREEPEGAPINKQTSVSSSGKTGERSHTKPYVGFSVDELITVLAEKDSRINFLEKRVEECEEEKQDQSSKRDGWEKEEKAQSLEMESLKEQLRSQQKALEEWNKKYEELEENYNKERNLREQKEWDSKAAKEALEGLSRLLQEKDEEVEDLNKKISSLIINEELAAPPASESTADKDVVSLAQLNEKLATESERLRSHLIKIEEGYTQEILLAEEREKKLREELGASKELITSLQLQLENNDELEQLRDILKRTTAERDKALNEASSLDDKLQKATTSLSNLQLVIEQLQRENERKLRVQKDQHRLAIEAEQSRQRELEWKLKWYEEKHVESAKALEAASRLTEKIDEKEETVKHLKLEIASREEAIKRLNGEVENLKKNYEGKVDKQIIKSLVLGYFNTPADKKHEVERLLARILDFSQEDMGRAGLRIGKERNRYASGNPSGGAQSLSKLFVEFLENESKPTSALPVQELAKDFAKAITGQKPASGLSSFTVNKHVRNPSTTSMENQLLSEASLSSPLQPVIPLPTRKDSDPN